MHLVKFVVDNFTNGLVRFKLETKRVTVNGFSLLMSTTSTSASVLLISTVSCVCTDTFSSYAVTRVCIRGELARRVMNDNVKARRVA